jgi:hypothetical protein
MSDATKRRASNNPKLNRLAFVFAQNAIRNGPSKKSRFHGPGGQNRLNHAVLVAKTRVARA